MVVVVTTDTPVPSLEDAAEPETAVVAATTREPQPTRPSSRPVQPTRITPGPDTDPAEDIDTVVNTNTPAENSISGVYLGLIGVLLVLAIVLGVGWARAARR
jgi:hypothetical protein